MRTALVTGANRGIGEAIARALEERGMRVLAASRTGEATGTGTAVALALDDPVAVETRGRQIEAEHGPVDVLVNNAAVLTEGDVTGLATADFMASLAINAAAPFALIRALGPGMRDRGWGRIVNVSSDWGAFDEGLAGPVAYSVSKATLNALTVSAARTLGSGVKVNAACPGWVRTRMGGSGADRSPEEGADTPVWLATLPDDGPTGGFFRDRAPMSW